MTEAERARRLARHYVALVEALQQEGMRYEQAREEARFMALMVAAADEAHENGGEKCPMCGK